MRSTMPPSMMARRLAVAFCLAAFCASASAQQLTLTGQIITTVSTKTQPPRFNVKLYPPKATGKPLLVTTADAYGRFRFGGLSSSSYLLEIYLGTVLVYQEVVQIARNTDRKIDLRKK